MNLNKGEVDMLKQRGVAFKQEIYYAQGSSILEGITTKSILLKQGT